MRRPNASAFIIGTMALVTADSDTPSLRCAWRAFRVMEPAMCMTIGMPASSQAPNTPSQAGLSKGGSSIKAGSPGNSTPR